MAKLKLSDKRIISIAAEFRAGMIGDKPSALWCFMICAPLAGLLRWYGLEAELVEGYLGDINHVWLKLPDGRVLDPTADQFNDRRSEPLPAVYLGPALDIHPSQDGARV